MIHVGRDFSRTPGGRYRDEGEFSGEDFRTSLLVPALRAAIEAGTPLTVDLDGTAGYSTGFLEEAFGGLVRVEGLTPSVVWSHLRLGCTEEPYLSDEIRTYIEGASRV